MSEPVFLDDVLTDIFFKAAGGIGDMAKEEIEAVKLAFKNDGYMKGGEFYKRFSAELCPANPDRSTKNVKATYSIGDIKEAARRAAGMK